MKKRAFAIAAVLVARAGAEVQRRQAETVGVGMGLDGHDPGDADALGVPVRADGLPALDFGGGVDEASRQFGDGQVDIDVFAQP